MPFHQQSLQKRISNTASPPSTPLQSFIESPQLSQNVKCNYILTMDKSKYELAQYLYGCLHAPAISTLETAIRKGNLISWPDIGTVNFNKYVGKNEAHEKGYLDQERSNLRSTRVSTSSSQQHEQDDDSLPDQVSVKYFQCYSMIIPTEDNGLKGITYSDQTVRFPYKSSRGNKYIMVCYDYDTNAFLLETYWITKHLQISFKLWMMLI